MFRHRFETTTGLDVAANVRNVVRLTSWASVRRAPSTAAATTPGGEHCGESVATYKSAG